jgi:hypothetical protein
MNILLKILILIIFYLTPLLGTGQDNSSKSFPFYVELESNFTKVGFEKKLNFTNNLDRNINLTYEGNQKIILEHNGLAVKYGDSFILPASGNLAFKVIMGKVPLTDRLLCPLFRSDTEVKNKDTISICLNQFEVSSHQFMHNDSLTIELSKSTFDNIAVYFPSGGTETTISVYKNIKSKKPIYKIWYEFSDNQKNYIVFKKSEKGKYFITLASCHWAGRIWLNIK